MSLMVQAMKARVGNPLRKLVLIKLADNASDTGECWPAVATIAYECEISSRSVQTHIRQLVKDGFVRVEERRDANGVNRSNIYHLTFNHEGENRAPYQKQTPAQGEVAAPYGANRAGGEGEGYAPPGANDAVGEGAGAAPRISQLLEPVKEPKDPPLPPRGKVSRKNKITEYSPEFEIAWAAYPRRAGGQDKAGAFKAWSARIREGVSIQVMLDGTRRYADFVVATGAAGTQYVKQAKTFYGPSNFFLEAWEKPEQQRTRPGGISVPDTNIPAGFRG
ncbi:TPA: helix-turn-helix domain-containing protein [Enterobacter chengduensis]|nr:helix-turn-helix domain-containing protein [Enterobacter chengduensis]HDS5486515.1 helix-turn-helix domain-containing protein [Enterobacter chengduensis]HDS5490913.1 helix-turn-helix domain-containing protein [Enterobacter chengduensis]HDT2589508.1 helix-turn-helix domain-containing protein [Enterobacter chengduensis]